MNQSTLKTTSILVVDDEEPIRRMLEYALREGGYRCSLAANGEEALQVLETEDVDVVISDIAMPKMDGIELTERIRKHYGPDVILMTGYFRDFTYGKAIASGASDFLQKPFDIKELLIRLQRVVRERAMKTELNQNVRQLRDVLEGVIHTLSLTIEARDPYTSGHQRRVTALASAIAQFMNLPEDQITGIRLAGLIHDLGKISVPAEILAKPSNLSDIEFSLIKTHPKSGYDILKQVQFPWPIAEIVYQHHERLDGSGYPRGLKGQGILLEARILAVADVIEAMSSHRPYRPSLGLQAAMAEIMENRGTFYDPAVIDACTEVVEKQGFKFDT